LFKNVTTEKRNNEIEIGEHTHNPNSPASTLLKLFSYINVYGKE